MKLAVRTVVDHLRALLPAAFQQALDAGLPDLELQGARLGLEALDAEERGLLFTEAAKQHGDFPLIARLHHGLIPFLEGALPTELVDGLRAMLRSAASGDFDDVRFALLAAAMPQHRNPHAALWRLLAFQGCRMNLWLFARRRPAIEFSGVLSRFDRGAERLFRRRLASTATFDETLGAPLDLVLADLVAALDRFAASEASRIGPDVMAMLEKYAEQSRLLSPPDKVLLRNDMADLHDDEERGAADLCNVHPRLFSSADALYKRRERAVVRGWTAVDKPTARSFADVVAELERELSSC